MTEDDLRSVLSIEMKSFSTPWNRKAFYDELHNPRSILRVAEVRGIVVGYLCASQLLGDGHILDLAVHRLYRRMGIASMLVQNILSYLRIHGCKAIFLEVRASNRSAQEIYRKFGFDLIGKRKNYYRSPIEDAIVMKLDVVKN